MSTEMHVEPVRTGSYLQLCRRSSCLCCCAAQGRARLSRLTIGLGRRQCTAWDCIRYRCCSAGLRLRLGWLGFRCVWDAGGGRLRCLHTGAE